MKNDINKTKQIAKDVLHGLICPSSKAKLTTGQARTGERAKVELRKLFKKCGLGYEKLTKQGEFCYWVIFDSGFHG